MASEDKLGRNDPYHESALDLGVPAEGTVVQHFSQRVTKPQHDLRKRTSEILVQDYFSAYNKLSQERREIRLCILQSGAMNDPLICALITVSLEDNPVYETLSYVWGDPILNGEIIANGSVIEITKNLHTALRYLRKIDIPRVMWADGICINQSDLDECSAQVTVMGDIYRCGKEVQIWLGEAEEMVSEVGNLSHAWVVDSLVKQFIEFLHSQGLPTHRTPLTSAENAGRGPNIPNALKILELLATDQHLYLMPYFQFTGPTTCEPCPVWLSSLDLLSVVLGRPWWRRVWTLQEAALSSKATVHIGGYQAPISLFVDAVHNLWKHKSDCCFPWQFLWHGNFDTMKYLNDSVRTIEQFVRAIEDIRHGGITLITAFSLTSTREASDSRDHVYALHGLLKRDHGLTKPNYHMSAEKVFTNSTKAAIFEGKALHILSYAVGIESSVALELASWVCDWSRQPSWIFLAFLYNASNGERFITEQTADEILTVEACMVDVISIIGNPCRQNESCKEQVECLGQWWSLVELRKSHDKCAFWRTVLLDVVEVHAARRRILPEDLTAIDAWWDFVKSAVQQGEDLAILPKQETLLNAINIQMGTMMKKTRLWLTSQGFLGTGPQTVNNGDEVCIVKGSKVPLILRPIEQSLFNEFGIPECEQGYLFVGQCYLHGFMDGEAVKPDAKWQRVHLC